ncbi:MAG: SGNH/GDSL hydrolase family protein [Phycisphaerae bacterium]|nr:SGNH/GDSL hydrolase family protein [Phycisphaerae bacterium]
MASILAAVLLAEAMVRVLGLGPVVYAPRRFEPDGGVPFTTLAGRILVYQPNTTFASVYDPAGDHRGYLGRDGRIEYHINRFGLRGPDISSTKEPGTFCVLCLGDSFTFGEGVRYSDTYPARLQRLLADTGKHQRVEVINAGVQAYGTREAVAFYILQGYQFQPDVLVLAFVLNDVTDFAETIRQNEALTRDTPLSMPARVSKLWEILERDYRAGRLEQEFLHTTRRSFQSERWDECKGLLKDMERLSQERHFRFVVVLFPVLLGLDGAYPFEDLHILIARACHDAGCEFVDLLDVYRGRQPESLWVHPTDQHPNEIAHDLAAERIAKYLASPSQ